MIRVAIIDDHAIVRAGLRQYFSEQVDLTVVAEAANGREALDIVRKGEVDVMVMDLSMPDQSGVDALAAIKARAPDLPILILSGFPEEHYATTLLRQGASGYLNKECDLVIIDIFLRKGSGLGVLQGLAGSSRDCKRVVLSNFATPDMRRKCLDLGADKVFDKSNEIDGLINYCARLAAGEDTASGFGALPS